MSDQNPNPAEPDTQDPDAPEPSDPATPDDPDAADTHEAPAVEVNADEADVTVEAPDQGEDDG